jgi:hypothetical protein
LGNNINAIKKTRDALIDASKEGGVEVNTENIKIANTSSENVENFIYFGMTATNQNCCYRKLASMHFIKFLTLPKSHQHNWGQGTLFLDGLLNTEQGKCTVTWLETQSMDLSMKIILSQWKCTLTI